MRGSPLDEQSVDIDPSGVLDESSLGHTCSSIIHQNKEMPNYYEPAHWQKTSCAHSNESSSPVNIMCSIIGKLHN